MDAILLFDGSVDNKQLLRFAHKDDVASSLRALGEGFFVNPLWGDLAGSSLVGCAHPQPMLAVFGSFNSTQRARLRELSNQIKEVGNNHKYIDYHDAERSAEHLAHKLIKYFGRDELSRFQYTAIPRGGLIVLGMLSYLLNLRPDQIVMSDKLTPSSTHKTLVVVDDCALSGVRFQQFLKQVGSPRVVFCPLYAASALCRAIERAEPSVEVCINARELYDMAPEKFGASYPQWRARQQDLMTGHGYWVGMVEHFAFAWCEPQTKYWNTGTSQFEAGWNVFPPDLCLNRRIAFEKMRRDYSNGNQRVVALQSSGSGPICVASRVLWAEIDTTIAVARMPEDASESTSCFGLEGVAADMWRCVLEHGTLEGAESTLLECYDVDPARLREDLAALVLELEQNGILRNNNPL